MSMELYDARMGERKRAILKAIIEAHIQYGEPVGSKYLADHAGVTCSPATIRNEMAELEALGYLEQPHTSSGRVPSEQGYRFYVDSLIQDYKITTLEAQQISSMLHAKLSEIDKILEQAAKVASTMTNYTALAVKAASTAMTVNRFETIYLDEFTFLLVMLTSQGAPKTKTVKVPMPVTAEEIQGLCRAMNHHLAGVPAERMVLPVMMAVAESSGVNETVVNAAMRAVYEVLSEAEGGTLKFGGVDHLLRYPEYSDMEKLKKMLSMFEKKDDLIAALKSDSGSANDDVRVIIGSENSVDVMSNSALVLKNVRVGGQIVGTIGIIGPCRMDYSKVIALVDRLSDGINEMLGGNLLGDGRKE